MLNRKLKWTLAAVAALAVVLAGAYFLLAGSRQNEMREEGKGAAQKYSKVVIDDRVEVWVEIADTAEKRARGLSGHKPLGPREGMFFIFPKADLQRFWMKDMLFAIDIIWIGSDLRIIGASERVSPESYPALFSPDRPAQFVLEVPAGFYAEHGLQAGDALYIE